MINLSSFKPFILAGLVTAGVAYATPSSAAPVTFDFSGTLTQVSADSDPPFNGDVGFGTPFFGKYIFESTTLDAIANAGNGSYTSPAGLPYGIFVTIGDGNNAVITEFLNIGVINGASDFYTVLACEGGSSCPNLLIELTLQDFAGAMLSNDALPLDTFPLGSAFGTFTLRANLLGNQIELLGNLTSLACTAGCSAAPDPNPTAVPEPATLVLCMTGIAGSIWTRTRRRALIEP